MFPKTILLGNCETSPVFIWETGLESTDSVLPLLLQNWNIQIHNLQSYGEKQHSEYRSSLECVESVSALLLKYHRLLHLVTDLRFFEKHCVL